MLGHLSLVVLGFTARHARSGTTLVTPAPATVWATDSDATGPRPLRARLRSDGPAAVASQLRGDESAAVACLTQMLRDRDYCVTGSETPGPRPLHDRLRSFGTATDARPTQTRKRRDRDRYVTDSEAT